MGTPYESPDYKKKPTIVKTGTTTVGAGLMGSLLVIVVEWVRTGSFPEDGTTYLIAFLMAVGAGVFAGLRNWTKRSDNPVALFLKDVIDGVMANLGLTALVLCLGLTWGCATTPDVVLQGGQMQAAGLIILREKVNTTVDGYAEKYARAIEDGYREFFLSEADKMTSSDGTVVRAEYEAFALDMAEDLAAKKAAALAEAERVKAELNGQFDSVQMLGRGVQAYNEATGVSDASIERLTNAGASVLSEAADVKDRWDAQKAAERQASRESEAVLQGGLMEFLNQVQRAGASQEAGEQPDMQWLLQAYQALKAGLPVPAYPGGSGEPASP